MFSQGFRAAARSSYARSAHQGQFSALLTTSTSPPSSTFQPEMQPTTNAKRNQSTLAPQRRDQLPQVLAPVYVHHISKTVLQHLQTECHEWLQQTGLNRGLRLNANGTFALQFPSRKGHDAGRIWTSYDVVTRQHWLSVYRGKIKSRFLLKDSFTDAATVDDLISRTVDSMIAKLNKYEG